MTRRAARAMGEETGSAVIGRPGCPREPIGLSAPEAAAFLSLSESAFLAAVKRGELPYPHRLGGRNIWHVAELDRALLDLPRHDLRRDAASADDEAGGVDWSDTSP
jgi:predicted DNA-binding transcriptional regulator AlpA